MQPSISTINEEELTKAAQLLMDCLPDHASELIHEISKDYSPVWQVFAGVVLEAHMNGVLSAFTTDPAWQEGLKQYIYKCKFCDKEFTPKQYGQLYCSNECGFEATRHGDKPIDKPMAIRDLPGVDDLTPSAKVDLSERLKDLIKKTDAGWSSDPLPA
jgi:hypothetical protein